MSRQHKGPDSGRSSEPPMVVHEYDGIREEDNRLPRWWLWSLYTAIAFAAGYWLYFHTYERAPLPSQEHAEKQAALLAEEAEKLRNAGEVTPEMLATLLKDSKTVEEGKGIFEQTCVTCHDAGGKGKIGPNLTDPYWLHGSDSVSVYKLVRDGYLPKQMPAWGKPLGEARVRAVTAYVLSLRNTNAAGGKAAQGVHESESAAHAPAADTSATPEASAAAPAAEGSAAPSAAPAAAPSAAPEGKAPEPAAN